MSRFVRETEVSSREVNEWGRCARPGGGSGGELVALGGVGELAELAVFDVGEGFGGAGEFEGFAVAAFVVGAASELH